MSVLLPYYFDRSYLGLGPSYHIDYAGIMLFLPPKKYDIGAK